MITSHSSCRRDTRPETSRLPVTMGAGQPVVDVDPLGRDAERGQGVTLRGEVLLVGGDPGVADQQSAHGGCVPLASLHRAFHFTGRVS
jgi:hypothetical protein